MKNRKDVALILTIRSMKMSIPDAAVISFRIQISIVSLLLKRILTSPTLLSNVGLSISTCVSWYVPGQGCEATALSTARLPLFL